MSRKCELREEFGAHLMPRGWEGGLIGWLTDCFTGGKAGGTLKGTSIFFETYDMRAEQLHQGSPHSPPPLRFPLNTSQLLLDTQKQSRQESEDVPSHPCAHVCCLMWSINEAWKPVSHMLGASPLRCHRFTSEKTHSFTPSRVIFCMI